MGRLSLILLVSLSYVSFICCLSDEQIREEFEDFAKANGRKFDNDLEEQAAYETFSKSFAQLKKHQRQKAQRGSNRLPFDVELNRLSLMTEAEIKRMNGVRIPTDTSNDIKITPYRTRTLVTPPESVDWVALGAVNAPISQGRCGSCWAFAATGALEGAIQIKTRNLVKLSEENLVDCDKDSWACAGGWPPSVWSTYTKVNKLMTQQEYPYSNLSSQYDGIKNPPQTCAFNASQTSQQYTTKGTIYVNSPQLNNTGDENVLLAHVAVAPVAVAIDAMTLSFQMYRSGVYSDPECKTGPQYAGHAVLVVGYGTDNVTNLPYWLVKNSWGSWWGDGGYIRMKRGGNICGIANYGARPELNY